MSYLIESTSRNEFNILIRSPFLLVFSELIDERGGDLNPDENLLEVWVKSASVKEVMSDNRAQCDIIQCCIISCHKYYIASYHAILRPMILYHTILYHIKSYYITLHGIHIM